jgi:hypothetical protein
MIVRAPRPQGGFTVLRNETLSDRRLSWAARGLLAYLLSKPDHWRVSPAHLATETAEARVSSGRDAVYALLGELEAAGYIVRVQARAEDGRMTAVERHIHEEPQPASPLTAQPETVEPHPVNPTLVSTEKNQVLKDPPTTRVRANARANGQAVTLPLSPTVIELPLNVGVHAVTEENIEYLRKLYPSVNVRGEFAKMLDWCNKNPSRRKTKRGISDFITTWLSKAQDEGKPNAPNPPPRRPAAGTSAIERVRAANAAAGHQHGIWPDDDDHPF